MIKYDLEARPNAYGFGRDYTLYLTDTTTGRIRRFMLGQDAKVFSRMLGMDMRDAVDYYAKKAKSRDFSKVKKLIARDIISTLTDGDISQARLRTLMQTAQDWDLHVGGG